MIFVTGPLFAGKQQYIQEKLGWSEEEFRENGIRDVQDLASNAETPEDLEDLAERLSRKQVVISTEIGGGVIPLDPAERANREKAGILNRLLAQKAQTVIRVCCGLPQVLKSSQSRHYTFFQNRECEFFPCHKTQKPEEFNCLFCYCPLYALGHRCGGDFRYTQKGYKDCSDCLFPHIPENYERITGRYEQIMEETNKRDRQ